MSVSRIQKLDNAKFFLIACVVFGHFPASILNGSFFLGIMSRWVYLFHMPAFVFIAGMLSKNNVAGNRWRKIFPYIILCAAMNILNSSLSIIKGNFSVFQHFYNLDGVPWFALAMFWWTAITIFLKKRRPKVVLIVSVVLSILSGFWNSGGLLALQRTVFFYPFFYIGYLLDAEQVCSFLDGKRIKIISFFVIIVSVLVFAKLGGPDFIQELMRGRRSYTSM